MSRPPNSFTVTPAARSRVMGGGKRLAGGKSRKKPDMSQFSKWMIADIRPLLWIVTLGGFLLAFYCVYKGYTGALPWIGGMVGLPWAAHGVICTAYLTCASRTTARAASPLRQAKAVNFNVPQEPEGSIDSPAI